MSYRVEPCGCHRSDRPGLGRLCHDHERARAELVELAELVVELIADEPPCPYCGALIPIERRGRHLAEHRLAERRRS